MGGQFNYERRILVGNIINGNYINSAYFISFYPRRIDDYIVARLLLCLSASDKWIKYHVVIIGAIIYSSLINCI